MRLRANRPTQACARSRGRASDKKAAIGCPPIAAMSLSPRARQRCPIDSGECQSRRKWMPSSEKSVVTNVSFSSCLPRRGCSRSTAQSSPIPVTIAGFLRTLAVRRIWAINAFSPITTATTISESAGPSQSESGFQSYWMADAWTSMSDGLGAKSVVRRPLRNASGVAAITQLK